MKNNKYTAEETSNIPCLKDKSQVVKLRVDENNEMLLIILESFLNSCHQQDIMRD